MLGSPTGARWHPPALDVEDGQLELLRAVGVLRVEAVEHGNRGHQDRRGQPGRACGQPMWPIGVGVPKSGRVPKSRKAGNESGRFRLK